MLIRSLECRVLSIAAAVLIAAPSRGNEQTPGPKFTITCQSRPTGPRSSRRKIAS